MRLITCTTDKRTYYLDSHRVPERSQSEDPRKWVISTKAPNDLAWKVPVAVWLESINEICQILPLLPYVGLSPLDKSLTSPYPRGLVWQCRGWKDEPGMGPHLDCEIGYGYHPESEAVSTLSTALREAGHYVPFGLRYAVVEFAHLQAVQAFYPKIYNVPNLITWEPR